MKLIKYIYGILIAIILGALLFLIEDTYTACNNGGWYCKYCQEPGLYYYKIRAEEWLGRHPCPKTLNQKHCAKWYIKDPRKKPKYIE